MLTELRVRDLGVIDDLTVSFGPGMTALTGETGAGKTLLVEALDLVLGGGWPPAWCGGAEEAPIEARFVTTGQDGTEAETVLARARAGHRALPGLVDGRIGPLGPPAEVGAPWSTSTGNRLTSRSCRVPPSAGRLDEDHPGPSASSPRTDTPLLGGASIGAAHWLGATTASGPTRPTCSAHQLAEIEPSPDHRMPTKGPQAWPRRLPPGRPGTIRPAAAWPLSRLDEEGREDEPPPTPPGADRANLGRRKTFAGLKAPTSSPPPSWPTSPVRLRQAVTPGTTTPDGCSGTIPAQRRPADDPRHQYRARRRGAWFSVSVHRGATSHQGLYYVRRGHHDDGGLRQDLPATKRTKEQIYDNGHARLKSRSACKTKIQDSFEDLVLPQFPLLRRFVRLRVRNWHDAEDAVQQTLVLAFRHIGQFRFESSLGTWLCRIAVNVIRGRLRSPEMERTVVADPGAMESMGLRDQRPSALAMLERKELVSKYAERCRTPGNLSDGRRIAGS